MTQEISIQAAKLVKAAIVFCQQTYRAFPGAVIEPLNDHYSDEDMTLEVQLPEGIEIRQAADALIHIALAVEDQYGVTIVTRAVREKGVSA